jgi:hypothetical protein
MADLACDKNEEVLKIRKNVILTIKIGSFERYEKISCGWTTNWGFHKISAWNVG